MRHELVRTFVWAVPALQLGACGPSEMAEVPELGESSGAVLYAPPAPSSGDVVDSTAFLGPVSLGGAVQAQFTTNPQYFSFSFKVRPGAKVKLEVTHLGSSMYLDTGLFVYGPRQASGGYGSTVVAQDDDSGYGQLSRLDSLTLAQGGEYLAVVSTGTGAGKRFRLQLDCLAGECAPVVDASLYAGCDLDVATRIEVCVQAKVEEPDPVLGRPLTAQEAFDACTGSDDAHGSYVAVCGTSPAPAWCDGGEAAYTQRMWPVCQDFYRHYYGLAPLAMYPFPRSSALDAALAAGNTRCHTGENWCDGALATYTFPWISGTPVFLDVVAPEAMAAALGQDQQNYQFQRLADVSYAQFAQDNAQWFPELTQVLPGELGNGSETPLVAHYYTNYPVAPGAKDYHHLYVVVFPVSYRVAVFQQIYHEI